MKRFNFTKYDSRGTPNTNKISLNAASFSIGKEAFESIGKPDRVAIYFDTENKAIKLVKDDDGRKIVQAKGYFQLTSTLSQIMPRGRYYFKEDGIFILEQQSSEPTTGEKHE